MFILAIFFFKSLFFFYAPMPDLHYSLADLDIIVLGLCANREKKATTSVFFFKGKKNAHVWSDLHWQKKNFIRLLVQAGNTVAMARNVLLCGHIALGHLFAY